MKTTAAFVFPGQGSQFLGMFNDLAQHHPQVLTLFEEASDCLGFDLWKLTQEGPESQLNDTRYTQPAMLTADVAAFTLLKQQELYQPTLMAGHSLGEYAALVAAEALSFSDAVLLVSERGQLMQEAIPVGLGAMAAIVGLPDDKVTDICHESSSTSSIVSPANFNAIGQVVIAGHTPAVEKAIALAETLGARMAKIIPVSVPCHCPLLEQISNQFERSLNKTTLHAPTIPVISNVDLSVYDSPDTIRVLLKQQLYKPVRWVETIQKMKNMGIETIVESGPGKVLSGLVKRIDKTLKTMTVNDVMDIDKIPAS